MHYQRKWKHGDALMRKSNANGEGGMSSQGYVMITHNGKRVAQHIIIAELALGKKLPKHVEVHHVNENKTDNKNSNLVICPSAKYHQLLHYRAKALFISGDANNLKCMFCKRYDTPSNIIVNKSSRYHSSCRKVYRNNQQEKYHGSTK